MTTFTQAVFAKEDMSTDRQEDSSADRKALQDSQDKADQAENVKPNNDEARGRASHKM